MLTPKKRIFPCFLAVLAASSNSSGTSSGLLLAWRSQISIRSVDRFFRLASRSDMKTPRVRGGSLANHYHLVPRHTFESLGQQAFAVAIGVIARGIEVVDTKIDGAGDDGGIGRETGAKPDRANFQSCLTQGPIRNRRWRLKRGAGAGSREPDGREGAAQL